MANVLAVTLRESANGEFTHGHLHFKGLPPDVADVPPNRVLVFICQQIYQKCDDDMLFILNTGSQVHIADH